jgi:hypothetical protein
LATLWQGEFDNDVLHGFGRKATIHFEGDKKVCEQFVGNWK